MESLLAEEVDTLPAGIPHILKELDKFRLTSSRRYSEIVFSSTISSSRIPRRRSAGSKGPDIMRCNENSAQLSGICMRPGCCTAFAHTCFSPIQAPYLSGRMFLRRRVFMIFYPLFSLQSRFRSKSSACVRSMRSRAPCVSPSSMVRSSSPRLVESSRSASAVASFVTGSL